jgi:hypothetical protein
MQQQQQLHWWLECYFALDVLLLLQIMPLAAAMHNCGSRQARTVLSD